MFKKITLSDEAWAVANVVNQYDGWCKKFEKSSDMKHPIHEKSLGKWTSSNKNPTTEGTKKEDGRNFVKSG